MKCVQTHYSDNKEVRGSVFIKIKIAMDGGKMLSWIMVIILPSYVYQIIHKGDRQPMYDCSAWMCPGRIRFSKNACLQQMANVKREVFELLIYFWAFTLKCTKEDLKYKPMAMPTSMGPAE